MMFNAELAVSGGHLPARALMDTGATHCYCVSSRSCETNLQVREQDSWLSLANGMKAMSKGKAVLSVDIQSYQGAGIKHASSMHFAMLLCWLYQI